MSHRKMAKKRAGEISRVGSCGESSRSRSASTGYVGTWLKLAGVGLAFFGSRSFASDPSMGQQPAPPKYTELQRASSNLSRQLELVWAKLQGKDTQIYNEMNCTPPKPLQVFEYGPSRPAWLRNPKKYKYQYVCVVATMGSVEEGIWHRRRAPRKWTHQPPFHIRIVRPNPAGMLDMMLSKKKVKLVKKNVTITRTDNRTGRVVEKTRQMTGLERTDSPEEMPEYVAEMLQAQQEGRKWEDPRPSKGRWGPSNIKEVEEEGVLELLAEAGIETPEEVEDISKVVDKQTGKKFDMRRYFDVGEYKEGYSYFNKLDSKLEKNRASGRKE